MIATIWEVWNDRHGDLNKSEDLIWRTVLILAEAGLLALIFHKSFFLSVLLCASVFVMFFDYLIAYVLIRNKVIQGNWFTYLAKKGIIDVYLWKNVNPWVRLALKLFCLAGSIYLIITK